MKPLVVQTEDVGSGNNISDFYLGGKTRDCVVGIATSYGLDN
jgi:hypothetical protein